MRLVGWVGLVVCSIGLLVDLAVYQSLGRLGAGQELPETLRTLFWGMVVFPIGGNLSLFLLRRSNKH